MRHLFLTSSLVALSAAPLAAQEAFDLGEITIFSNQTPVALDRSGATVEIVEEDALQESGTQRVIDKIDRVPGISISGNGPVGARQSVFVRGLSSQYVPVYLDGIDLGDPASTQTAFNWGSLLSTGLGRVEVLKGSQSALYGSEAIGGVINISTLSLAENGQEVRAAFEYGSFDTASASVSFLQKTDRSELGLTVARYQTDGYSALDENDGWIEADDFESNTLILSGKVQATDALTFGGTLFIQDEDLNIDGFGAGDEDRPFSTRRTAARVFAEWETGVVANTVGLTYAVTKRRDPLGFSNAFDGERVEFEYAGVAQMSFGQLSFGASHSTEKSEIDGVRNEFDIASLWVEGQIALSGDVDASLALRAEDHSEFGSALTGRAALAWRATEETVVRASLGTGFRAPSLNELFGPFGSNPLLQPEESISFDLGVEHSYASGAGVKATLFYSEIDNLIIYDGGYVQAPGKTVSQGLELSGNIPINDRFTAFGSYTYTDAKNRNGVRQVRVPRHELVLGVEASLTDRLSAELTINHYADRVDGFGTPTAEPDYTVLNMNLGYQINDTTEAYLRIENLTDEEYQTARGFGTSDRAVFFGIRAKF